MRPAPPRGQGRRLVRADGLLRLALGAGWIAAALGDSGAEGALALAVGLCGLATLAGRAPRTWAGVGLGLCLWAGAGVLGRAELVVWGVLAGAAAARLVIHSGESGPWLAEVRRLRRELWRALLATELLRASDALTQAGDAFERAGWARRALAELDCEPERSFGVVRALARAAVPLLRPFPRLRARLSAP